MKKTELAHRKSSVADQKKSQKKISSFFTKPEKAEDSRGKEHDESNIIVKAEAPSDEGQKKRKIDDPESHQTPLKIMKFNTMQNNCDKKHNISQDGSAKNKIWLDKKSLSPGKNSPEKKLSEYKENIDTSTKILPTGEDVTDFNDDFDTAFETCDMEDIDDFFEKEWHSENKINFNSFQRCKITDIKREQKSMSLLLEQEDFAINGIVICSGFWKDAQVEKNDIVVIQAKKEGQNWIVDNNNGFLVIKPDILVSGTTIVGGLFCSRRAVLAEKFRKIETLPHGTSDTSLMSIGSLVHQLLQKAICQPIRTLSDVTTIVDSILKSRDTTGMLYASNIEFKDCQKQMYTYATKVFEFIQHYINGERQRDIEKNTQNFKGCITEVQDIEENIWLPKLGIKGKVDVTVQVNINSRKKIMPLELKTGRTSYSLEHKGQIMLYIMMMALTGHDTDSGLLLYLKDNSMQEIQSKHPERRDLIQLRNTLAHYFSSKSETFSQDASVLDPTPMELPEPINHRNACNSCPYNTLCCVYLSKDSNIQLSDSHPLTTLGKQILERLKPSHIEYFLKWVSLLQLDESSQSADIKLKDIWTLSPEKRESKGTCLCNLRIIGRVTELDSRYRHNFVRSNISMENTNNNFLHTNFSENEYVIISTDTQINISAGFIVDIKGDSIAVLLDRDITKYNHTSFHIDKYSSSTFLSFNLGNIGGLLDEHEFYAKLRDIVIDRKPATFAEKVPHSVVSTGAKILKNLNENQQRAILKTLTAKEYILIKGMPGTGKTQTLVALIKLLHKLGSSVLVTAHTHSAVDNIFLKLLDEGLDFMRLGSTSSIHPLLRSKGEEQATIRCDSPESLDAVYRSKNIVGVTCYGSNHVLLAKRIFDVCIVDESTQVMQPTVLRPLYSAHKFILTGDPDQLPPVIKSATARKLGADESLFGRLDSKNNTVILTKQYRMNKTIMDLANKLTYRGELEIGSSSVETGTFKAPLIKGLAGREKWVQKVLSQNIDESVIVVNTGRTYKLDISPEINEKFPESDGIYANIYEAAIILRLTEILLQVGVEPKNIGIIAPYRAHVLLLKGLVHKEVEVNTVDQYQGRDKEIIFYSCARSLTTDSDKNRDRQILEDHRRLTVAVTRAKHKLIVVSDKDTLMQYSPFRKLFALVEESYVVNLKNGSDDFEWKTIVQSL